MSTVKLNSENEVDPVQIASVTLEEKGVKISSKVVSVASGDVQDLRVPEDSLIVRMKDGSEFVIRGSQEAKSAWEQLQAVAGKGNADFEMSKNSGGTE